MKTGRSSTSSAPGGRRTAPRTLSSRSASGFDADHYYQALNGLLEQPEALEHDPLVVRRLLRLRDRRRRLRLGPPSSAAAAAEEQA